MRYLVDASTIIALNEIGELGLLHDFLGTVMITQEVLDECRSVEILRQDRPEWITVLPPSPRFTQIPGIGPGESSLIASAQPGDRLILDDSTARRVVELRGLDFTGLLGLIGGAAEQSKISGQRGLDLLDRLAASGFHMSQDVYVRVRARILRGAG
ncbi:MAG TPA: hypothetical protein VI893_10895 [Thermoplasmata archaeon]|nr:hypothetical protein [Thermoplasmata archaeon]